MKSISTIISEKEKYYKETGLYNPHWRQEFRYWRRTYLELMDSNGYSISVANYYLHLLDRRYRQSKEIRKRHEVIEYWKRFEVSTPSLGHYYTFDEGGANIKIRIYPDETRQLYILPNGQKVSYEMVDSIGNLEQILINDYIL